MDHDRFGSGRDHGHREVRPSRRSWSTCCVLPSGYDYLGSTASAGTLSYDAPTRTLEWSGPVEVGQVVVIDIDGRIASETAGMSISNQAELR